jgi:hypothetical protein
MIWGGAYGGMIQVHSSFSGATSRDLILGQADNAGTAIPFLKLVNNQIQAFKPLISSDSATFAGRVKGYPALYDSNFVIRSQVQALATNSFQISIESDGITTAFVIPHNLTGVASGSRVFVTARNSLAAGFTYVQVDATNVTVNYSSPPSAGSPLWDIQIIK